MRGFLVALGSFALVAGCDGCGERPGAEAVTSPAVETPEAPPTPSGPTVTLRGVVRLVEGAEVPSFAPDQMGAREAPPEECTPPRTDDRIPVRASESRGLSNVVVTITAEDRDAFFARVPPLEPVRHEVTIRDCRLTPRVVGAARGDVVVLSNEMYYPFLPTTGTNAMLRGLIKGEPQEVPIEQVGLTSITCGMLAGCGRADVVVAATRLITVTDAEGSFALEGVPAGLALRVHAWHPLFHEAVAEVTPREGTNEPISLEIRPLPAPEPVEEVAPEGTPEDTSPLF